MKICMKIVAWDIIDDLPAPNPDELMQLLSNAELKKKQGRIHGYPSRVRVGRSGAGESH